MKSIYISGPYTAPDREGEDKNILTAARVAAGPLAARAVQAAAAHRPTTTAASTTPAPASAGAAEPAAR